MSQIENPQGLKIAGALSLQAVLVNLRTGELEKQITLFEVAKPAPKHSLNSYASPTPVLAGNMAYFHFGTYGTACLNRTTGETVWTNETFHIDHQTGPGSSPVVWNDLLIVHFDGMDAQFLTCV